MPSVPWPAPPSTLARAGVVGAGLGVALLVGQLLTGATPAAAVEVSFATGALVFGFALFSWGSALMGSNSLGAARARLSDGPRNVDDVAEAMAVLTALGGSWMVVTAVASWLLNV